MTVMSEHAGLPDRIRDAADKLRDLTSQAENERARRDDLIAEAVDHAGMTIAAAARAAGISKPQVIRILSRSSDDN